MGADRSVVTESRRRITAEVGDLPPQVLGDVELLATELLANAVIHGSEPVTVGVQRKAGAVRVAVSDASDRLPSLTPAGDLMAESGRGFLLVDSLATRWGLERRKNNGKTVWFELEA